MGYKFLIACILLPAPALAQRHHHEEHESRHELALFLGGTVEKDEHENETFLTVGFDYEFRFLPRLGIAAEVEFLHGADAAVFAFPAVVHVYRGLMVLAGPGWETGPRQAARLGDESRFLIRTGIQYGFHLGGSFTLIPAVDFDFLKEGTPRVVLPQQLGVAEQTHGGWETVVVFGVKVAWGF